MTQSLIKHECLNCNHTEEHQRLVEVCPNCGFYSYYTKEKIEHHDDGQPSWEQEWSDFGETYNDEPEYIQEDIDDSIPY